MADKQFEALVKWAKDFRKQIQKILIDITESCNKAFTGVYDRLDAIEEQLERDNHGKKESDNAEGTEEG